MKQNYPFRRILSALILLLASNLSWAENDLKVGDYFYVDGYWYVVSGDISVYFRNPNDWNSNKYSIPSHVSYEGKEYRVTSIGKSAFANCYYLSSVDIPGTVESIGDFAFWGRDVLISINIPTSVKSIGHRAFSACESLTSIDIPYSEASIGDYAFSGCI